MFTNVKFNFPQQPVLTGDPAKDVQTLAKLVVKLQDSINLWLEKLNQSGAVTIGGGAIDNVTIGGNAPITLLGVQDLDIYEGTTDVASLTSASNILKLTWNVGSTGDKFFWNGVGNYGLGTGVWGASANNVIGFANAAVPSTSPAGVGQLYSNAGALTWRGSGGTVTVLGAA